MTAKKKSGTRQTAREAASAKAMDALGRERFVAFIRAIRNVGHCTAVDIMNGALDEGHTPDAVFFDGEEYGFHLSVIHETPARVHIEVGCQAAPMAGDGGEWDVTFSSDGRVLRVTGGASWIS